MKKLLSLILTACMLLTLAACSGTTGVSAVIKDR